MLINFATYFTFDTEIYFKLCQEIYDSHKEKVELAIFSYFLSHT